MTALAEAPAFTVTAPGVYDGMPEDVYHSDPVPGGSLSASGAKMLLPPSCPARYEYDRLHPKPKAAFDYGTAAHKLVLGTGPEIVIVDAADWRTNKAKQARDEAHERGAVPLLISAFGQVEQMAAALRRHPLASALLDPAYGQPEQSLFWEDSQAGIWRRARLDWLRHPVAGRRLLIPDYKTADSAAPENFRRAAANFGYHLQNANYVDGARALGLDDEPVFLFIVQEKTPPFLVNVIGLEDPAIEAGRERMRMACEIWRDCTEAGRWPGYPEDITYVSLPPWAERPLEDPLS